MKKSAVWALLAAVLGLTGCASTEALYAEYDQFCPVDVRVTDTGMVMVTAIADGGGEGQRWEPAVYFGFDRDKLEPEELARLDRNLAILDQYPTLQLSVRAFTDQIGSAGYNRDLAQRRLNQVVGYLQREGVALSRIQQAPLGKELPILASTNKQDRIINRRVEMMLLDAQGRPLVLSLDIPSSGGDAFTPPAPVK